MGTREQVREIIKGFGDQHFTVLDLMRMLPEINQGTIRGAVSLLHAAGVIRTIGERHNGERGRPYKVFAYCPSENERQEELLADYIAVLPSLPRTFTLKDMRDEVVSRTVAGNKMHCSHQYLQAVLVALADLGKIAAVVSVDPEELGKAGRMPRRWTADPDYIALQKRLGEELSRVTDL